MTDIEEYRRLLISTEQRAQEAYDRTVLSLSGGALGISFAFVKQFLGNRPVEATECLMIAWAAWVLSLTATLFSHYLSTLAHQAALNDLDSGKPGKAAGRFDKVVTILNATGGILFIVGSGTMGAFVVNNLR
jgi:hypothetical protein